MISITYFFVFLFEQYVSFLYCSKKFNLKVRSRNLILFYSLSLFIQYSLSFISSSYINLLSFILVNFLLLSICYRTTIFQKIFHLLLLTTIMLLTEIITLYFFNIILEINLTTCKTNIKILLFEAVISKLLYYLIIYILTLFNTKTNNKIKDYSFLLLAFPLTSILIISTFAFISFYYDLNKTIDILFLINASSLLTTNILIFFVNRKIIKTSIRNTELLLQEQSKKLNESYYSDLQEQYDKSKILIHDIKNCLSNIRLLSESQNNDDIIQYIDSMYQGYKVDSIAQFTNNKLINVVLTRYKNLCMDNNINLSTDIRNIDFSRFSDSDLTSLLDNAIKNAYEAALDSPDRFIYVDIYISNESFLTIRIINSCKNKPNINSNILDKYTTLSSIHGTGTKIISKIVKKYSGDLIYSFNENNKSLTLLMIFPY